MRYLLDSLSLFLPSGYISFFIQSGDTLDEKLTSLIEYVDDWDGKVSAIKFCSPGTAHAYHKHEQPMNVGPPPTVNAGQELQKPS